jgi:hypothetical protein
MSRSMEMSGTGLPPSADFFHRFLPGTGSRGRPPGFNGRRPSRLILAAALWMLSFSAAHAYLVYVTPTVTFSDTASVTDSQGGAGTSNDNASLGSSELAQIDASLGVLTAVTLNLGSTLTPSLTLAGVGDSKGNVSGTGTGTAAISAPGVSYTFAKMVVHDSCKDKSGSGCSSAKSGAVAANQNLVASGSLDSYVGTGTVTVDRTTPTFNATQIAGTGTTQYDLNWTGTLSASYTYLKHAAPSFDGASSTNSLTLDFGTVAQNSSVGSLGFSIFNLADVDRTDLDLIGIDVTGNTGALGSDLTLFQNLVQGSQMLFYATIDTATPGSFLTTYTLTLSDATNIGAPSSQDTYTLTLTLKGTVTPVAIPDTVWLLGSGLIGVVGVARRKPR